MPQDIDGYLVENTSDCHVLCLGGGRMVDEGTAIKIVAVVGIALLIIFGYTTIQKAFGSLLPSEANIGIAGMLIVLGVLGYLWIRRQAEDLRE